MKALKLVVCLLGLSCAMWGQSSTSSPASDTDQDKISQKIKLLQDAMEQQQKEIQALQEELAQQKKAREAQIVNASYNLPNSNNPANTVQGDKPKESPLSVRIGGTDFTPGGFMDFNNIFRTVNTGNVVGTNFGGIPYSNTAAGHLTEFRSTGQYSRWNLKIAGKYGENNITGYIEGDFNGNDAANVFVTTNPHTLRLRLYFLDLKRGQWEFLGGQAWSLLTPNRIGVSPMPSDLATTTSTDGNIHVGVPYARDGQFRAAFHPNDHFSWAASIENPQQITNGEVVLPAGFSGGASSLSTQVDGVATAGIPNWLPDFMTKLAYDNDFSGRHFHLEAGGLMTSAKVTIVPTGATTFAQRHSIGGGLFGGLNADLHKRLRVLAYGAYGDGVGRYFNGLGPMFVVRPIAFSPTAFDVKTSMVHSGAGFGGFEVQAGSKTQFGTYYGVAYYQRNAFPDVTSTLVTKPIIGFGGANSGNSNNRAIQEGSLVWTQTLWRNPQYGAVLFINDVSYSTRAPWFVAAGAPKNAHMIMDHMVLRYVIP